MQITKHSPTPTRVKLTVAANQDELGELKEIVLKRMASNVKIAGFREGKAPLNLIEKQLEPERLQAEFLDEAINQLYSAAIRQKKLQPVEQPQVSITKFVPFNTLDFDAEFEAVGDIKLGDYKHLKVEKPPVNVTAKDVNEVIKNLQSRIAEKKEILRAAKHGDQVWIDFKGTDTKTNEPVSGASGKDYPLILGSNTFIPGFEPNLIGLKTGETKSFTITFPKDYGVAALQNRQVTFEVTATKVEEVIEPKLDDAFAAKVGPFKSLAELKADIKKQVQTERQTEAERTYENELVNAVAAKSEVAIPMTLVEEQLDMMDQQEKQNLAYRGQTWQEHLNEEGVTEEQHRERQRPVAEQRVKAGLVLSEIAEDEKISVTPEELEVQILLLKGQHPDKLMQAELDKPENRRDIISRMLTEKTIHKLKNYNNP